MQRYKCNTKEKKKTYLLGEHVDEEWWRNVLLDVLYQ